MLSSASLPREHAGIRLRRLEPRDAGSYALGSRDELVSRFGHLPLDNYTPGVVRQQIKDEFDPGLEQGTLLVLAIADRDPDAFLGSLVLFNIELDRAELGYWVAPWARGRGVATAAVHAATEMAWEAGIRRLEAKTSPDNLASQRVLQSAGFTSEGGVQVEITPSGAPAPTLTFALERA